MPDAATIQAWTGLLTAIGVLYNIIVSSRNGAKLQDSAKKLVQIHDDVNGKAETRVGEVRAAAFIAGEKSEHDKPKP